MDIPCTPSSPQPGVGFSTPHVCAPHPHGWHPGDQWTFMGKPGCPREVGFHSGAHSFVLPSLHMIGFEVEEAVRLQTGELGPALPRFPEQNPDWRSSQSDFFFLKEEQLRV